LGGLARKEIKMSMRELEASILAELKQVAKNSKIRQKDIMEWSTGEVKAQEGETYFFLPILKVHVCVKLPAKKTAQQSVQRIRCTCRDKFATDKHGNCSWCHKPVIANR
jgi:hypothetical protein